MRLREKHLKEHHARLKQIRKKNSKSNLLRKSVKDREAIIENKIKIHNIISSQRESAINRENSILFNKLMEISMGKKSQLPYVKSPRSKHNMSQSPLRTLPQLKSQRDDHHSLNFVVRKHEKQRIEKENLKLAAKLITEQSDLKKNKLLSDYKKIEEYKKRLRRVRRNSASPKKIKLPNVNKRGIITQDTRDISEALEENIANSKHEDDKNEVSHDEENHHKGHIDPNLGQSTNVSLVESNRINRKEDEDDAQNKTMSNSLSKHKMNKRYASHKPKHKKPVKTINKPVNSNISRYKDLSPAKQGPIAARQNKYLFEIYKRDPKEQQSILKKKKQKKKSNKVIHTEGELENLENSVEESKHEDDNHADDEDQDDENTEKVAKPKPSQKELNQPSDPSKNSSEPAQK